MSLLSETRAKMYGHILDDKLGANTNVNSLSSEKIPVNQR
jgi:hypothetical protein